MWVKVFSPGVESVEIVQRTEKRKRRARLYYMRYVLENRAFNFHLLLFSPKRLFSYGFVTDCHFTNRQPKHDVGSVENVVSNYLKRKSALMGQSGKR